VCRKQNLAGSLAIYATKQQCGSSVCFVSPNSSVTVLTMLPTGRPGSIPSRDMDFSLLHRFQTDSGTHPASYLMDSGLNQPEREADYSISFQGHESLDLNLHSAIRLYVLRN
jgi:hypothetical protein